MFDVSVFDSFINFGVFAVFIVLVFVELVGVVRRVANDNGDVAFVLPFDAFAVFIRQAKQSPSGAHNRFKTHVVQGVYKENVLKRFVLPRLLFVGVLNVEVGDVIRQNRHFIAVQFVFVFVGQAAAAANIQSIR